MLRIAWQTLRRSRAAFVGAFVALLCGAAVLTASGVLLESGLRATVASERYAGATLVVGAQRSLRPPGGDVTTEVRLPEPVTLSEEVRAAIAKLPGVDSAVGDYRVAAAVRAPGSATRPAAVSGHGWGSAALTPLELVDGRAPESDSEVVLDAGTAAAAGLGVGDDVEITVRSVPSLYRVSGISSPAGGVAFPRTSPVYFTDREAGRLSGHAGHFDAVGVIAADGADPEALAEAVAHAADTPLTVREGADSGALEFADVGASRSLLVLVSSAFGGTALLVVVLVVGTTLGLSVDQRRREFAVLRTLGSTPGQILRLVASEALLVALVGGVLGSCAGFGLAEFARGLFVRLGALPADLPLAFSPLPVLASVALTALAAAAGGLAAAVRPAVAGPVEALRESASPPRDTPRWRRTVGLVFLVLGLSTAMVPVTVRGELGAAGTGSAALLLVVGVALLGPFLLRRLLAPAAALLRRSRVSGFLAAAATEAGLRRLNASVTPLALALGFTVTLVYSQSVVAATAQEQADRALVADLVVADTASGGLAPEVVDAVRSAPGVAAVTELVDTTVFVPYRVFDDVDLATCPARGLRGADPAATVDLEVVDGDLADLEGETFALERSSANLMGLRVGDEVEVWLGDGSERTLRLVAVYERGMGFAAVTVPLEVLDGHTAADAPTRLLVRSDGDPEETAAALGRLAEEYPTVSVTDRAQAAEASRTEAELAAWINLAGLAMIVAYLAIAVVNTLVMATAGRGREFALLRLVGLTRGQVMRVVWVEALLFVAVAVLLGTDVAVVPLGVLSLAFLGGPLHAGPPWVYLRAVAATAVLGLVSVLLPARLAMRAEPVEVIALRE